MRCRRWKPMTRRRTWCADRSLAKCCALRVHVTHPYSRVSITSAISMRTFRLSGAVILSYNSGPNRLKHAHMRRIRRSISNERSALSWMSPPWYRNWFVCLYLWPAASMTSGGARDVWPGVRSNIFSVFLSDTVRPAASKTVTMTVIILASPSADRETFPASSAYNMPHTALRTQTIGASFPTATPSSRWTKSLTIYLSSLKRARTTYITAAKNMLNSSGDSTQPCRSPCVTSNHSECSPSSVRTRARIPSWNWRITVSIFDRTPRRVRTSHSSSRSTESYAFCSKIV